MIAKKPIIFIRFIAFIVLVSAIGACNRMSEFSEDSVLRIRTSPQQTKSYLSNGHHRWVTGDMLRILSPDGISINTNSCEKACESFDFIVQDWPEGKNPAYAVYCGQQKVNVEPGASGAVITARLENVQKLTHKESFGKTANLAVGELAKVQDNTFAVQMKNVCGLLGFSFSKYDDIISVEIRDAEMNPMAGTVEIMFDADGNPYVSNVKEAATSIELSASGKMTTLNNSDKKELPSGQTYYACVLPGKYRFKIYLKRYGGEKLVVEGNSMKTISRNEILFLEDIDEYAEPVAQGTLENESYGEDLPDTGLPMHIDFSRVGYHWGEDVLPTLPVKTTLTAPADGSDMTAQIQAALDATENGAVLLEAGTYNVSGKLYINHSEVVLRGEGDETVIFVKGILGVEDPEKGRDLITIGPEAQSSYSDDSPIVENVPVGQMWVRVADPKLYKVADDVSVFRPGTAAWISDIKMDQIAQNAENKVKQWTPSTYNLYSSRKVTKISADTVFLDNPVVMSLTDIYGLENRGSLKKVSCPRIRECGVENIKFVSDFDDSEMDEAGNHIDEDHCWTAIAIQAAEHCWVRNVTGQHFGYCTVLLGEGARYVTVSECTSLHPVSVITGSRRYAFHIVRGELCLVTHCRAEEDRHAFVLGPRASGPNVFAFCESVGTMSDVGPHQRWAMGALYDNQKTDNLLAVQDGGNNGTGHGWRGTNFILWNCTANRLVCQSPWATGLNWCVGCIGIKEPGRLKDRLDGEWISHGTPVSPASLYESQLSQRREKGIRLTQILF